MKNVPKNSNKWQQSADLTHEQIWLAELDSYLEKHLQRYDLKVSTIAYGLSMSERSLRDRLVSYTGLRPKQYIEKKRIQQARKLLQTGYTGKLLYLAQAVGFRTEIQLRQAYEAQYGALPDF